MLIDQYRKFVGCGVDSELLSAPDVGLVLASVFQVPGPEPDTSGNGDVRATAKVGEWKKSCCICQEKSQCVGCYALIGCQANHAGPCSALHLSYA